MHACTTMCHWCGVRARVHLWYAGLRQVASYLYCARRLPLTPPLGTHTQQTSLPILSNQLWNANQLWHGHPAFNTAHPAFDTTCEI